MTSGCNCLTILRYISPTSQRPTSSRPLICGFSESVSNRLGVGFGRRLAERVRAKALHYFSLTPIFSKGIASKPSLKAGESAWSLKSSFFQSTNLGSAIRLCWSQPSACQEVHSSRGQGAGHTPRFTRTSCPRSEVSTSNCA